MLHGPIKSEGLKSCSHQYSQCKTNSFPLCAQVGTLYLCQSKKKKTKAINPNSSFITNKVSLIINSNIITHLNSLHLKSNIPIEFFPLEKCVGVNVIDSFDVLCYKRENFLSNFRLIIRPFL